MRLTLALSVAASAQPRLRDCRLLRFTVDRGAQGRGVAVLCDDRT
eukprot:gene3945-65309_t